MAEKSRLLWPDYTKAFAIWLMVLCHFGLKPDGLVQFIYIFHMPVFFLISGYFDKGTPFSWDILKKNFKRIMIPYFFFSICSLSICWISPYLHPEIYNNSTIVQSFIKAFIGMFLMEDQVRSYAFLPNGPLWFLVALFNIRIIYSLICLCWEKCKVMIPIIGILGIIVIYYRFPFFSLDSAFISLPIYMGGAILRHFNTLDRISNRFMIVITAVICWLYTAFIGMKNGEISIDGCDMGNSIVMFYINAFVGSMACILTFKLVSREYKFIKKIGMTTMTILATHFYVGIPAKVIAVMLLSMSAQNMETWYVVLASLIALALGVLVDGILTKCCPTMIGKNKLK